MVQPTREQQQFFNRIVQNNPGVDLDEAAKFTESNFGITEAATAQQQPQLPEGVQSRFNTLVLDEGFTPERAIDVVFREFSGTAPVQEPEDEGTFFGEVGKAFVRGGLRVSTTSLRGLRALDRIVGQKTEEEFGQTLLSESIEDVENLIASEKFRPKREKGVTATIGKVVENLIPTVTFSLAGGGVGGALPSVISRTGLKTLATTSFAKKLGSVLGFTLGGSAPFGLAEFDSASQEVEDQIAGNPDLTDSEKERLRKAKNSLAAKSAFAEFGFEGLSRVLELSTGGLFNIIRPGLKAFTGKTLGEIVSRGIFPTIGRSLAGGAGEAFTEGATGFVQAGLRQQEGLPTIGRKEATLEGATIGGIMGLLFNAGIQSVSASNRAALKRAIENPNIDPITRKNAIQNVADAMRDDHLNDGQTLEFINNGQLALNRMVDNNEQIDLDVKFEDVATEEGEKRFREAEFQKELEGISDNLVSGEFTVEEVRNKAQTQLNDFPEQQRRLFTLLEVFEEEDIQAELQKARELRQQEIGERRAGELRDLAASLDPGTQETIRSNQELRRQQEEADKVGKQRISEEILNRNIDRTLKAQEGLDVLTQQDVEELSANIEARRRANREQRAEQEARDIAARERPAREKRARKVERRKETLAKARKKEVAKLSRGELTKQDIQDIGADIEKRKATNVQLRQEQRLGDIRGLQAEERKRLEENAARVLQAQTEIESTLAQEAEDLGVDIEEIKRPGLAAREEVIETPTEIPGVIPTEIDIETKEAIPVSLKQEEIDELGNALQIIEQGEEQQIIRTEEGGQIRTTTIASLFTEGEKGIGKTNAINALRKVVNGETLGVRERRFVRDVLETQVGELNRRLGQFAKSSINPASLKISDLVDINGENFVVTNITENDVELGSFDTERTIIQPKAEPLVIDRGTLIVPGRKVFESVTEKEAEAQEREREVSDIEVELAEPGLVETDPEASITLEEFSKSERAIGVPKKSILKNKLGDLTRERLSEFGLKDLKELRKAFGIPGAATKQNLIDNISQFRQALLSLRKETIETLNTKTVKQLDAIFKSLNRKPVGLNKAGKIQELLSLDDSLRKKILGSIALGNFNKKVARDLMSGKRIPTEVGRDASDVAAVFRVVQAATESTDIETFVTKIKGGLPGISGDDLLFRARESIAALFGKDITASSIFAAVRNGIIKPIVGQPKAIRVIPSAEAELLAEQQAVREQEILSAIQTQKQEGIAEIDVERIQRETNIPIETVRQDVERLSLGQQDAEVKLVNDEQVEQQTFGAVPDNQKGLADSQLEEVRTEPETKRKRKKVKPVKRKRKKKTNIGDNIAEEGKKICE